MNKNHKLKLKLNYPQIFLIGFGFLASSLAWSVYNSQVPLILANRFYLSNTLIGTIMTIDNFFGLIFQPMIGAWSDSTRTRLGRRLPWILISLPICMVLFTLIPLQNVLWAFMSIIIAFNLIMALWRSPVIALMPDSTPSALRSEANGIINLMGGLGSILAFLLGGILADMRPDKLYPFLMASILMGLALIVLIVFVREPDSIAYRKKNNIKIPQTLAYRWAQRSKDQIEIYKESMGQEERTPDKSEKKGFLTAYNLLPPKAKPRLLALLFAIFTWFMGFNAIETFFTLYATNTYGISDGQATLMLTGFSLAFLVFAIPAGKLAGRLGRKNTIILGLVGIITMFLPILVQPSQLIVQILLIIGGIFWACININSLPIVLEFGDEDTIGAFTGYYYLFSFAAAIVSPILYGMIQDLLGSNSLLFAYALICFGLALVFTLLVRQKKY